MKRSETNGGLRGRLWRPHNHAHEHTEKARDPRTHNGHLNPGPHSAVLFCLLATEARAKRSENGALEVNGKISNPR
jgi:hypothetical protein